MGLFAKNWKEGQEIEPKVMGEGGLPKCDQNDGGVVRPDMKGEESLPKSY